MTVKDIYESFTHKMAAKASWHRNYVTVILCITSLTELNWSLQTAVRELEFTRCERCR